MKTQWSLVLTVDEWCDIDCRRESDNRMSTVLANTINGVGGGRSTKQITLTNDW